MDLTTPALILNNNWQPIGVQPVTRAICMVFNDTACVIDPSDFSRYSWNDWARLKPSEDDKIINLVGTKIRVPEIVSVKNYSGTLRHMVVFNRRNLFVRDKNTCQYCGIKPGVNSLTVDHIIPRSKGGESSWLNCVLACAECNRKKADKTVQESGMRLLRDPYKPKWSTSFKTKMFIPSWEKFLSEIYWNIALEP